jgi:hypothetical protein
MASANTGGSHVRPSSGERAVQTRSSREQALAGNRAFQRRYMVEVHVTMFIWPDGICPIQGPGVAEIPGLRLAGNP